MANVAFFKFQSEEVDTLPASLTSETDSAALKGLLLDLYDNRGGEAACGQGRIIFGNTADGINAPVLLVSLFAIVYEASGEGTDDHLVFWMTDISTDFRIVP